MAVGGGFYIGSTHTFQVDIPTENIVAMYEEARAWRPRTRGFRTVEITCSQLYHGWSHRFAKGDVGGIHLTGLDTGSCGGVYCTGSSHHFPMDPVTREEEVER